MVGEGGTNFSFLFFSFSFPFFLYYYSDGKEGHPLGLLRVVTIGS